MWSAFRFGPRGATAALVLVSGLAVWGTTHGSGPFQAKSLSESLLLLQIFMGVLAMTVLMLCAALAERERGATALRQANDQLETRVRERTAQLELAHRQTRDSYLRLQELEALRDQLRHMIFHDLRTPLDALNYLLQLLEADTLSESQRATVALGRQSGQTLSGIIGDLLDVHIMEGGTLRLNWQELQPAQVVETALSQVHLADHLQGSGAAKPGRAPASGLARRRAEAQPCAGQPARQRAALHARRRHHHRHGDARRRARNHRVRGARHGHGHRARSVRAHFPQVRASRAQPNPMTRSRRAWA